MSEGETSLDWGDALHRAFAGHYLWADTVICPAAKSAPMCWRLPGCEICANVLAIARLLKSRAAPEKLLKNAAINADVLACARPEQDPANG